MKDAINATLRRGLDQALGKQKGKPFHTVPEDMGVLPHLNYDNIGDLLEMTDQPPEDDPSRRQRAGLLSQRSRSS